RAWARRNHPLAPITRVDPSIALARCRARWKELRKPWAEGFLLEENELAKLARRADAMLLGEGEVEKNLDVLAAAERMLLFGNVSLGWAVPDATTAFAMKMRASSLSSTAKSIEGKWWWVLVEKDDANVMPETYAPIRTVMCAASEEDYARARDLALEFRKNDA